MKTRTRVYHKASSADDFESPYSCRIHGEVQPVVSKRKSGYLHRRCSVCFREWRSQHGARYQRNYRDHCKRLVIEAYGGACECCGEDMPEFLSIDHLLGDGKQHREEILRKHESIWVWLAKNDCPNDGRFALRCFNCNLGRERNGGVCPHNEEVEIIEQPESPRNGVT